MDEDIFREIAENVESEWKMGGLSFGLYYDYAFEICKRYTEDRHLTNAIHTDGEGRCPKCIKRKKQESDEKYYKMMGIS